MPPIFLFCSLGLMSFPCLELFRPVVSLKGAKKTLPYTVQRHLERMFGRPLSLFEMVVSTIGCITECHNVQWNRKI